MATSPSSESPPAPPTAVVIQLRLRVPELGADRQPSAPDRPVRELPPVSQFQRYLDLSG